MVTIRKKIIFVFIIIILVLSFSFGFFLGKNSVVCKFCPPQDLDFSLFWEAWHKLRENYVEPKTFDAQKMIYGAIAGMVKSLEDPYTVFLRLKKLKYFRKM